MQQKSKKLKAKKEKDLKIMVDSFMRSRTSDPTFDLRRDYLGLFDRRRSSAGTKEECEE